MKRPDRLHLHHAGRDIHVQLEYSPRKRLVLTVRPSGEVIAKIPPELDPALAGDFIRKRSSWIDKHLRFIERNILAYTKYYTEGEVHPYLGENLYLRLHQGAPRNKVKKEGDELHVHLKSTPEAAAIEKAVRTWYRNEAIRLLTPRFHELAAAMNRLKLPAHRLRFYRMKRRWGSCSPKGVITLSTELIKHDPVCIDYVIVHELCHLKVPAHNKAFYALLESVLPDWKTRRGELNGR